MKKIILFSIIISWAGILCYTTEQLPSQTVRRGKIIVLLTAKFASDVAPNVFFPVVTFCKTDAVLSACFKASWYVCLRFHFGYQLCFSFVRYVFFHSIAA